MQLKYFTSYGDVTHGDVALFLFFMVNGQSQALLKSY